MTATLELLGSGKDTVIITQKWLLLGLVSARHTVARARGVRLGGFKHVHNQTILAPSSFFHVDEDSCGMIKKKKKERKDRESGYQDSRTWLHGWVRPLAGCVSWENAHHLWASVTASIM